MGWWGMDLRASVEEASFCLGAGSPSWAPCITGLSFSFLVCGFLGPGSSSPLGCTRFSWLICLSRDRIPSRQNFLRRRVLPNPDSAICVICGLYEESSVHLFISCSVVSSVGYNVSIWKSRNDVIFSGRPFSIEELVDTAKRSSWTLFFGKTPGHPCSLYK
ncbi:hypothetical protein A2U01_0007660 [Trifolium medium]|uniref:Uncharacterized protein n=1 Tax=Trifolium medium TaxID=97028 RepID=A0A392MH15_9FABA|nr:hypothetical protein [Trifolium medium]